MLRPIRFLRRGFTLIELLTATAISAIIITGVIAIAVYSTNAYNRTMSLVSATAVSRQLLDTLESDVQSCVIRDGTNPWIQCVAEAQNPTPNVDAGNTRSLIFFSVPPDRDRFHPRARGADRVPYRGSLCALRYRIGYRNPLPIELSRDPNADSASSLYRVIVNPETTFNNILPAASDATDGRMLNTLVSAAPKEMVNQDDNTTFATNDSADIFALNVVGLTPIFVFKAKQTEANGTTSTWYFPAIPEGADNREIYDAGKSGALQGMGGPNNRNNYAPVFFNTLQITAGKFAITPGKPAPADWLPAANSPITQYRLSGIIFSLTVLNESGAEEVRARDRVGQPLTPEDWARLVREHSHTFVRHVRLLTQD